MYLYVYIHEFCRLNAYGRYVILMLLGITFTFAPLVSSRESQKVHVLVCAQQRHSELI